jgi:hypothetical protein
MNEAWPKVLARLTGKHVYNLAIVVTVQTSITSCFRRRDSV